MTPNHGVTAPLRPVMPLACASGAAVRPAGCRLAGLVAEQRGVGVERFTLSTLPRPELPRLRDQPVRQKDFRRPAALRDLLPDADADSRRTVWCEYVTDVEADDLGEAEAGAEGEGDDGVVAEVAGGRAGSQGLRIRSEVVGESRLIRMSRQDPAAPTSPTAAGSPPP